MIKRNELRSKPKEEAKKSSSAKSSAMKRGLQNILGGGFLTKDGIVNLLPFLFFATFLTILYIGNIYYAEKDIREINALKVELKELRYEYITSKSRLMNIGKQSEVSKRLAGSGVKESLIPPYKLFVIKTEKK